MAVSGNNALLGIAPQTAKGTVNATPMWATRFTGGKMDFSRDVRRFEETAGTRDQSPAFVAGVHAQGSPACYLRPTDGVTFLEAALGQRSSDAGPTDFTHTITPVDTQHTYFTIWQSLGAGSTLVVNRFEDCIVDSAKISGGTGQGLEIAMEIIGLGGERLAAAPAELDDSALTERPLLFSQVTVTKAAADVSALCEDFEINIENGHSLRMGAGSITGADVDPGERKVSGSFTLVWDSVSDYNNFHFGSPTGTAIDSDIVTEAININAAVSATLGIQFDVAAASYTAYDIEPDKSGGVIKAKVAWEAEYNGTDPVLEITAINQTDGADYDAA